MKATDSGNLRSLSPRQGAGNNSPVAIARADRGVPPVLGCILLLAIGTPARCAEPARPSRAAPAVPDVVYIPTPHDVVDRMLRLAEVTRRDVVYDLGCGDGRILVAAARKYGCRGVGFDIDLLRIEDARTNVRRGGVESLVQIEQQDLFRADLRPATVVVLYLCSEYNTKLLPQLEKLPPGSRIVSHQFGMDGMTPDKVVEETSAADGHKHTLYLWTTPLRKRP